MGLFLAAGIVWIFFVNRSTPGAAGKGASVLRPFSQKLVVGEFTPKPTQYYYQTFTVANTVVSPHVVGSFHATGGIGNDIQVVLAEKGNSRTGPTGIKPGCCIPAVRPPTDGWTCLSVSRERTAWGSPTLFLCCRRRRSLPTLSFSILFVSRLTSQSCRQEPGRVRWV